MPPVWSMTMRASPLESKSALKRSSAKSGRVFGASAIDGEPREWACAFNEEASVRFIGASPRASNDPIAAEDGHADSDCVIDCSSNEFQPNMTFVPGCLDKHAQSYCITLTRH